MFKNNSKLLHHACLWQRSALCWWLASRQRQGGLQVPAPQLNLRAKQQQGCPLICCKVLEFPLCLEFLHLVFSSALFREVQHFCNLSLTRTRVWISRIDSDVCILLRKDKKKKKTTAFLNCARFIVSQKADHLDNTSSAML